MSKLPPAEIYFQESLEKLMKEDFFKITSKGKFYLIPKDEKFLSREVRKIYKNVYSLFKASNSDSDVLPGSWQAEYVGKDKYEVGFKDKNSYEKFRNGGVTHEDAETPEDVKKILEKHFVTLEDLLKNIKSPTPDYAYYGIISLID